MFLHKQSRPNLIELAFSFWISLAENSVRVLYGGIFPTFSASQLSEFSYISR